MTDKTFPKLLPNKALQTDERRAVVTANFQVALAPLAAERQNR